MAEALDQPIGRDRRNVGIAILRQQQTRFRRADFGDGGGDRTRQAGAAGDRGLHDAAAGRDRIDQIGIDEKRRQRQHRRGDLRLIGGQRQDDGRRCARACRQHIGQRPPHQRRRVVEQHQHRALGRGEIVGRQIRIEVAAGQRSGRLGALTGRRDADIVEKMADDHGSLTPGKRKADCDRKGADLTKRSP